MCKRFQLIEWHLSGNILFCANYMVPFFSNWWYQPLWAQFWLILDLTIRLLDFDPKSQVLLIYSNLMLVGKQNITQIVRPLYIQQGGYKTNCLAELEWFEIGRGLSSDNNGTLDERGGDWTVTLRQDDTHQDPRSGMARDIVVLSTGCLKPPARIGFLLFFHRYLRI